jgi:hypothetical protein
MLLWHVNTQEHGSFSALFLLGGFVFKWFRPGIVYDNEYGAYWDEYRALVPWKVLPGVY